MDCSVNAQEFRELRKGVGEKRKESTRFYRNPFDKGYQRKLGQFIISGKGKMENAE